MHVNKNRVRDFRWDIPRRELLSGEEVHRSIWFVSLENPQVVLEESMACHVVVIIIVPSSIHEHTNTRIYSLAFHLRSNHWCELNMELSSHMELIRNGYNLESRGYNMESRASSALDRVFLLI